ncbi:hypothetical protein [Allochromatium tepidum]|uniref:Uncharacterized protein n=1 Tax=Allochromatium tepidum TaxID=553982 RepID=A0ABM7QJJ0_9GAMM|nr:hypothetical protein [Allochromatium tepidum]BCU05930.1 hypothetical protein Atep_06070 [Allochromatium tepidum]
MTESRCRLWEASGGGWISNLDDGAGRLHNRARHHTAWLNHWMRPVGGVMAAEFTDETLSTIRSYGGRRDSPIWTGSYLAAEALRFMSTGAPDAERALRETVATLHRWWDISGDRGYLARYAAPADSPEPVLALLSADDPEVHRDVLYENRLWHWRGNISRDQYQGLMLGYSTEGLPEYAERRRVIAEHYARQADTWLDIAARWRNTNRGDSGYFGLNIGFMPLYTWTRLETDPARKEQKTVLDFFFIFHQDFSL